MCEREKEWKRERAKESKAKERKNEREKERKREREKERKRERRAKERKSERERERERVEYNETGLNICECVKLSKRSITERERVCVCVRDTDIHIVSYLMIV